MRRLVWLLVLGTLAALPASATAVVYGIGDSPGAFARCPNVAGPGGCSQSAMRGFFGQPTFRELASPASRHQLTEVRIFVDYDAIEDYDGSTTAPGCALSRVAQQAWRDGAGRTHAAAQSWNDLRAELIAARIDGLTPVVAIAGYASPNAIPPWDRPFPDPTTTTGYWEYYCGVQGVLNAVSKLPAAVRPHIWEAVNEPDAFATFDGDESSTVESCASGSTNVVAGAGKAACAYVLAAGLIHQFAGHAGDTVIAGVFTHPSTDYLAPYARMLATQLPGAQFPATWSVHDYADVTRALHDTALPELASFDQALAAITGGAAHDLWITESGTLLTDRAVADDCPAAGVDDAGTLGACVNGHPARQLSSAAAFLALPSAGDAVPISHLFWYQWEGEANWDSGLTDTNGDRRVGWCALYGSGTCTGSPEVATGLGAAASGTAG
ncbi:MAG: hypothetical protein JOZ07_18425 [Solirubrobacterales bacterium]|nr:hypothetical protein [Solirubrobacterales bacterium]